MKLYRDTLRSAWTHAIQRPGLWIFGFFSTLVFGASGELDRYLRFMNSVVTEGHFLNTRSWLDGRWAAVFSGLVGQLITGDINTWVLVVLVLAAALLVLFMMSISVGALIHSAEHKTETFAVAFAAGRKHWLQLAVLLVVAYLVVTVLTLAVVTLVLNIFTSSSFENVQLATVLVAGIVFVPLVIIASFLVRLAAMAIVLENLHIGAAVKRAWQLFVRHWLIVLEMSIAFFILVAVANLVVLFGLIMIFLPYFVGLSVGGDLVVLVRLQSALYYGQWVYLLLSFFTASLLSTWQWSAWTFLFQTLRTGQPSSSLVGLIETEKMRNKVA